MAGSDWACQRPTCLTGGLGALLGAGFTLTRSPCSLPLKQGLSNADALLHSVPRSSWKEDRCVKQSSPADAMAWLDRACQGPICLTGGLGTLLGIGLPITWSPCSLLLKWELSDAWLKTLLGSSCKEDSHVKQSGPVNTMAWSNRACQGPTCLTGGLGAPLGAGLTLTQSPCRPSPPQTRVEWCRCFTGESWEECRQAATSRSV